MTTSVRNRLLWLLRYEKHTFSTYKGVSLYNPCIGTQLAKLLNSVLVYVCLFIARQPGRLGFITETYSIMAHMYNIILKVTVPLEQPRVKCLTQGHINERSPIQPPVQSLGLNPKIPFFDRKIFIFY